MTGRQLYGWPERPETSPSGPESLRFSVVIPTLNQAETIEDTLQSIFDQDYDNVEIIVADGGSNDGTLALLERYRPQLARVIEGPDRGQSDAINKGFAAASGDIFCWLNSDDYFLPGALRRVADRFASDSGVRFVVGCGDVISKDHRFLRYIPALPMTEATLLNWKNDQWVLQQCCFWSRSLWQEVGGVDESLHLLMDYDLWFRLSRTTEASLIDEKLAVMRYYPEVKTVRQRSRSSEELAYVYAKNGAFQALRDQVAELVASRSALQERLSGIEASLPVRLLKRLSLLPSAG
ncbi:MAG: glycosyltransferase family 2 protein [Cyanobium sp.]